MSIVSSIVAGIRSTENYEKAAVSDLSKLAAAAKGSLVTKPAVPTLPPIVGVAATPVTLAYSAIVTNLTDVRNEFLMLRDSKLAEAAALSDRIKADTLARDAALASAAQSGDTAAQINPILSPVITSVAIEVTDAPAFILDPPTLVVIDNPPTPRLNLAPGASAA